MRVRAKVLAWIGVGIVGLALIIFVIGPALFASIAFPLPTAYRDALKTEALANNISPNFLAGLIYTESHWNPAARSGAGAVGLTQFTQSTARAVAGRLGVNPFQPNDLINNPNLAIKFGAYYISDAINRYGGDKKKALIAYNGGGGAVIGYERGYAIPGTVGYANKVIATAAQYDAIYGMWWNRTDLPDITAKPQSPAELVSTLSITDFWKTLLFDNEISGATNSAATPSAPTTTFWQNLFGQ